MNLTQVEARLESIANELYDINQRQRKLWSEQHCLLGEKARLTPPKPNVINTPVRQRRGLATIILEQTGEFDFTHPAFREYRQSSIVLTLHRLRRDGRIELVALGNRSRRSSYRVKMAVAA